MRISFSSLRLLSLLIVGTVALGFVVPVFRSTAAPQTPDKKNVRLAQESVPGEILVRFRDDAPVTKAARSDMQLNMGGRQVSVRLERLTPRTELVDGLRLAHVDPTDTFAAIEQLRARPDVLYAEPNYILHKTTLPNDPRFNEQWPLRNTSNQTADLDAEQAWDITTGSSNVVVGVIDEGIDINHSDLASNIWTNPADTPGNGVDDDNNGFVDDVHGWDFAHNDNTVYDGPGTTPEGDPIDGHGTFTAGIIGGVGNNGVGISGVNWQVRLLPLKFLGPTGGTTANVIRAYDYAKSLLQAWQSSGGTRGANVRVLNNSYGGRGNSQAALDAIRSLSDAGILFIASAGNEARNNDRFPVYPAGFNVPNVVSVGSFNITGLASAFANYGQRTVDILAPGEQILSTIPGNSYVSATGTSASAPFATGTAALLCAANSSLTMRRLRAALVYGGSLGFSQLTSSGKKTNARSSLDNAAEVDLTTPAAVGNLQVTSQGYQRYSLSWTAPGDDNAGNGNVAIYEIRFSDSDLSNPSVFEQSLRLLAPVPSAPGSNQSVIVNVPFRHPAGFIGVRAVDNAGNTGPITVTPLAPDIADSDPYIVSTGGIEPLSTGGTALGLHADDQYLTYQLPFDFTHFGTASRGIIVSTNGALHFTFPSQLPDGTPDIDFNFLADLSGRKMIAGLWDDLRTDRRVGDDVYVVIPDPTRVIFRWQAVTYNSEIGPGNFRGENPVNFEIELRIDGTIVVRYGDGNQNLLPVVGASGGEPDPYVVDSHTSQSGLTNLTLAPAVTFTPRRLIPLPTVDVSLSLMTTPDQAATGELFTYLLDATHNSSTQNSYQTVVTDQLPAGATFVSCTTSRGTCSGPPVGSTGTVTVQLGTLAFPFASAQIVITVQVTAQPGATLTNTANVSGFWPDPNPSNNSATSNVLVREPARFDNIIAVSAGGDLGFTNGHTLALKSDGHVYGWGANLWGQLGDGVGGGTFTSPVLAVGLSGVTAIDAGYGHSLALKSNGTVWAFGDNGNGQSGAQQQFNSFKYRPTQVAGLLGSFTAIAAGAGHSLALRSDGTVWAWGYNGQGALGDGTTSGNPVFTPVQTAGLTNVIGIAAGSGFSVAVKADGTVWAWGANVSQVLGLPFNTFSSAVPVQVAGISGVQKISAGGNHVLALKNDGTVWAWGDNSQGQLSGSGQGPFATPRQVSGLSGVTAISGGILHSLALKSDGTVWAWGDNSDGELGIGNTTNSNVPVNVPGLTATAVSAGGNTTAVLLANGTIRMFGRNGNGQLGDRTRVSRSTPVEVVASFGAAIPFFSPDGGTFNSQQGVTISCQTSGAVIYYTTDGSEPNENGPAISNQATLVVDHTLTLKAKAVKPGWPASPVRTANFVINGPGPTPTPTPIPGVGSQDIVFARTVGSKNDIFVMNTDGSNVINMTNNPADDSSPSWSPDGTTILFSTDRTTDNMRHITLMNADGSDPRMIGHFFGLHESMPAWSRDGARIAYVDTSPFSGISWISEISSLGALLDSQNNRTALSETPTWSADGTKIAYAQAANSFQPFDIFVVPSNSLISFPTNITNNSFQDVDPSWSPDGTKIAFASNRDGDYELYLMNADGSNPQRLTNSAGTDRSPSWSPDGSKIVFVSQRDGNAEIYVMNVDGTNVNRLTNNTVADSTPSWRSVMASTVQFSASTYSVSESVTSAVITVTRTGNPSAAASVNYSTIDNDAAVRCDDQVNNQGAAYARCDYATTIDTLRFAAGETSKTFAIPLVDDVHVEGPETVQLVLSGAQGALIGAQSTATLTITDNDTAGAPNPIDSSPFFVRQQYLDFLSREPEPAGFQAWLNVLNNCSDVNNNPVCDRNIVSSSFFRSQEFQLKGLFVFKFYRLTLNRLPTYAEISSDMRKVTGQTSEEVFAKRDAFAQAWVLRQDFKDRFQNLNNNDLMDRLMSNVGVDQLTGSVTRETLINDLVTSRKTRAEVVRAMVEHPDVDAAEYNRAFVAMQYYGYLRRMPEPGGYQAWLNYLNANPTDFRTMVNGFMNSTEYRLRFGPP